MSFSVYIYCETLSLLKSTAFPSTEICGTPTIVSSADGAELISTGRSVSAANADDEPNTIAAKSTDDTNFFFITHFSF
ncbi:hypothetical protein [Qingrenia yutianensis]|uniref:Uncharacterized protein n=1 Tax=Qingrenia yutianensis TaxID=2763676 RepID=A0A926ISD9_9FIRM|nr:hypothetical protein [Qingrenia yutianensis]MBC8596294.1 hypothetical protein [Qingrenia yutianensis]